MSHDTLVHRDTFSVVRRLSKAKTDCERFVRLWLLLVVTIVSENRQRCELQEPRRRETYLTALHRAQRTAPSGEPDHNQTQPFSPIPAHCPHILASFTRIISFYLFSTTSIQIRAFIILLFITCFLLHMLFYGFVKYSSYAH